MKLSLIALVALLLLYPLAHGTQAPPEPEAVPFRISSYDTPFAMQGDFEGVYRIYPNSIEISLSKAVVRISEHCPYKGHREFAAIRFMLATETPGGKWTMAFKSQKFIVGRIMNPGDEHSLGAVSFFIPKEETTDLSRHWLAVQMDDLVLDDPKGKTAEGFAFAGSCKDIFTRRQEPEALAANRPCGK